MNVMRSTMNFRVIWALLMSLALGSWAAPPAEVGPGPGREKVIAVIGSSVAAGWVTARDARQDMQNGYAFRLGRLLAPRGFKVVNISVPGDTTQKVLDRLEKDLFPLIPDFAVIALSLENEGIRGIGGKDPAGGYAGFKENLRSIIARCRTQNIIPVIGTCYANDNFDMPSHYEFITQMNLEIGSWDVPSINLLGALDRGDGLFVEGMTFDLDHPADAGHRELFYSIVPSLFEALAAGKPQPRRDAEAGGAPLGAHGRTETVSYIPDDILHSFTSVFNVRPASSGVVAEVRSVGGETAKILVTKKGGVEFRSSTGAPFTAQASLLDGSWHSIGLAHHFLKKESRLFVDGRLLVTIPEDILPVELLLGGVEDRSFPPAKGDFREWLVYRSVLNAAEMATLQAGKLLQSSLEVYAPLQGEELKKDRVLENRAHSTARVIFNPSHADQNISRLEADIIRAENEERIFVDPAEKRPVPLPPRVLEACTGDYEVASNLVLTVEQAGSRLFLLINGGDDGKTELFPLSEERFFVRSVGPEIEVLFLSKDGGRPDRLLFKMGGQEMTGKRRAAGLG
jgi:lysophospholipase L1-like esterase